jgi:hypothetical protein
MPNVKQPQDEFDRPHSLWCMDRNPLEVDYEWIKRNAYPLKDLSKVTTDAGKIRIGSYLLENTEAPGRIRMTDPSGQCSEVDETVLEDLIRSFF